jgi:regulatory protein
MLERAGFAADEAEGAVQRMRAFGYLDDARFAAGRAETLASRGAGDRKIELDLQRHGVDLELRASALAALEPERARAGRVVERRGATPATARLLASRGFSADAVDAVIADLDADAIG